MRVERCYCKHATMFVFSLEFPRGTEVMWCLSCVQVNLKNWELVVSSDFAEQQERSPSIKQTKEPGEWLPSCKPFNAIRVFQGVNTLQESWSWIIPLLQSMPVSFCSDVSRHGVQTWVQMCGKLTLITGWLMERDTNAWNKDKPTPRCVSDATPSSQRSIPKCHVSVKRGLYRRTSLETMAAPLLQRKASPLRGSEESFVVFRAFSILTAVQNAEYSHLSAHVPQNTKHGHGVGVRKQCVHPDLTFTAFNLKCQNWLNMCTLRSAMFKQPWGVVSSTLRVNNSWQFSCVGPKQAANPDNDTRHVLRGVWERKHSTILYIHTFCNLKKLASLSTFIQHKERKKNKKTHNAFLIVTAGC